MELTEDAVRQRIDEYENERQKYVQETQRLMAQAQEMTTIATRLEGAVQALRLLIETETDEDTGAK